MMTSMQRVLTALGHREPDKVPLFLLTTMHGAKEMAGTRLHGAQRRELGGSALPRAEGSALSPF